MDFSIDATLVEIRAAVRILFASSGFCRGWLWRVERAPSVVSG
jgi:hypothetical protein